MKTRENPSESMDSDGFISADFNLDICNPRDLAFRPAARGAVYKRFAAGKTLAQAESTPAEHVKFTVVSIKRMQVQSYISQQFQNFRI